jgi:hypothetical protein
MMTDVVQDLMQSWKENRFVVAGPELTTDGNHLVVLTNFQYWNDHADELTEWCRNTPNTKNEGMTVVFNNEQALMMFILRWS